MARGRRRVSAVGSALTVAQLLNEAQRGAASSHLRYAKMLWELATSDAATTRDQLVMAMKWFATVAEPTIYQSRLLNFFGTFAIEATSEDRVTFIECLLEPLTTLTYAKDPTARWRFCQLLHALVGNLPADAELSDDVITAFEAAMEERLEDGKPVVRAVAVRALARLPDPGDSGDFRSCPLTQSLLDMLAAEKSKAVRKAILATLPCSEFTRKFFMERTRDEADDVRKMAYLALAERVPLSALPVEDAAAVLRSGLTDRAPPVRDMVASQLVTAWLESVDGEPVRLVHALNVQAHPEECELLVRTLLDRGVISGVHLGRLAESDGMGLHADFSQPEVLMGPASALFWRVICEWLHGEATSRGLSAAHKVGTAANIDAAAAAERLEALEAALPSTVAEMADIIAKHAAAGARYRFSTGQLIHLATTCMDFADAAGRSAACSMLQQLLTDAPSDAQSEEAAAWEEAWHSDSWLRALAMFLRKVYGSPAELAGAMLDITGSIYRQAGFEGSVAAVPEQAWVHALGVAGLMLEQLRSARPALAAGGAFGLQQLLDGIIRPGMGHRSAKVRRDAVRCLGLYCSLEGIPTPLGRHLVDLRQLLLASGEAAAVKAAAVQALGDVALQRGPKGVDLVMAEEMEARFNIMLDPSRPLDHSVALQQEKALMDLLLEMAAEWAERFESCAAGRKKGSRRSRGSEDLEQQAVLGAALVEALARLARSHLYWVERQAQEGRELAMDDMDVIRVLVDLVVLYFNPAIEAATLACQALPVFFQNYAELTPEHQQYLATAFLPAARTAAAEDKASGKKITAASCTSSKVMGFMAQLLMTPYRGDSGRLEPVGHEMLVDLLLREAWVCTSRRYRGEVPKPYLAALCRVAAALEVFPVGEADNGASVRTLKELARQVWQRLPDRAMRRDLDALLERLSARAAKFSVPVDPFTPEEVEALLDTLRDYDSSDIDFPLPFDAVDEESDGEPAPAAGGRAAAKTPARGKAPARGRQRQQAAASSGSDDESDGGPQMPESSGDEQESEEHTPARIPATASRRQPQRAARSARKPLAEPASPSSDEEEDSEEEDEGDDALSPLAENSPAVVRPTKARRLSSDSVSALRQALQENRIS